jgi:hypothetical protein
MFVCRHVTSPESFDEFDLQSPKLDQEESWEQRFQFGSGVFDYRFRVENKNVSKILEFRKVYKVLEGKPEEKRPLGKPKHGWEDGIRMDLREIGWRV